LGALADDMTTVQHSSDADYLAGLSDAPAPAVAEQPLQPQYGERQPAAAQVPAQAVPEMPAQDPAYGYAQQQPDPYAAYQQTYDAGQDPYGYQQQGVDPYAYQYGGGQHGYDDGQQGYAQPQPPQQPPHAPQAQPQALDETSLFDTSMISAEQLRAYEQGRGH
ncbi:cell division initiation protein, partial [Streptomyces scabiei]